MNMRSTPKFLLAFSLQLLAFSLCHAAMHVRYNFQDLTSYPEGVKRVTITPLSTPAINQSSNIVSLSPRTFTTFAGGYLIVSNMFVHVSPDTNSVSYLVTLTGNSVNTSFTNTFPADTAGLVLASAYISASVAVSPGTIAYSQSQADARFLAIAATAFGGNAATATLATNLHVTGQSNIIVNLNDQTGLGGTEAKNAGRANFPGQFGFSQSAPGPTRLTYPFISVSTNVGDWVQDFDWPFAVPATFGGNNTVRSNVPGSGHLGWEFHVNGHTNDQDNTHPASIYDWTAWYVNWNPYRYSGIQCVGVNTNGVPGGETLDFQQKWCGFGQGNALSGEPFANMSFIVNLWQPFAIVRTMKVTGADTRPDHQVWAWDLSNNVTHVIHLQDNVYSFTNAGNIDAMTFDGMNDTIQVRSNVFAQTIRGSNVIAHPNAAGPTALQVMPIGVGNGVPNISAGTLPGFSTLKAIWLCDTTSSGGAPNATNYTFQTDETASYIRFNTRTPGQAFEWYAGNRDLYGTWDATGIHLASGTYFIKGTNVAPAVTTTVAWVVITNTANSKAYAIPLANWP